jgi:hydroxyacylglutathione hydrolase
MVPLLNGSISFRQGSTSCFNSCVNITYEASLDHTFVSHSQPLSLIRFCKILFVLIGIGLDSRLDLTHFICSINRMLDIIPLSAFKDNYIWLLANNNNQQCAIVDPGDATPVLQALEKHKLTLRSILITHHHHDHVGGVHKLHEKFPDAAIYGPAHESIPDLNHPVKENDIVDLPFLDLRLRVIDIPGHTLGHIAYYGNGMLFCGDTLFSAGCGRIFEGTPAQMFASLTKIANLPDDTLIYCAHEYTQNNLRFAQLVEHNNNDIKNRLQEVTLLREKNLPTLPSKLSWEKLTNPFLRGKMDSVINSLSLQFGKPFTDPVDIFKTLRAWKDTF